MEERKMMTIEELEKYCREGCEFIQRMDGDDKHAKQYILGRITGMYRLWEKMNCPEGFGDEKFYESFDRIREEFCDV